MSSTRGYIDSTYLTTYLSGQTLNADYKTQDDLISAAEQFIDSYVGPQRKWFQAVSSSSNGAFTAPDWSDDVPAVKELRGRVSQVVSSTTFKLQLSQQNAYQNDFFALCNIEIIGGTGVGQTNHIAASTLDGQLTVTDAWASLLDTTSVYRIYQLGKFPRVQDVYFDSINQPNQYYKTIPDEVRRAVAAQCVYMNTKGREFFTSDAATLTSEHLTGYSYTRKATTSIGDLFIAPEAKEALKYVMKRTGRITS